jgi:hypothetical protein
MMRNKSYDTVAGHTLGFKPLPHLFVQGVFAGQTLFKDKE